LAHSLLVETACENHHPPGGRSSGLSSTLGKHTRTNRGRSGSV
jgi:hypothetical protein